MNYNTKFSYCSLFDFKQFNAIEAKYDKIKKVLELQVSI